MFWGSFSSNIKGPSVFWEKDWNTITAESYQAHIVPLIHGWYCLHPHLQLMQDGAPSHQAQDTRADIEERGIPLIYWPPYSPDLNPIEPVWNIMKDHIADNYPVKMSYDQL